MLGFNATPLSEDEMKLIYDNYIYISPGQGIGVSKYSGMISTLKKYCNPGETIVEIGCSEGYLLSQLREAGYTNLIGIEPGPQAQVAQNMGLTVIQEYFNEHTLSNINIDGFYLMHVFEHFSNPFVILDAMIKRLSATGKIIIEIPNFGGYHHHHLFFYNIPFLARMFRDRGMAVVETICEKDILRIVVTSEHNHRCDNHFFKEESVNILEWAELMYSMFLNNVDRLNELFRKYSNSTIYWWGAGLASVLYLNQVKREVINRVNLIIVDGDKNKWQRFIPGLGIEVQPYNIIKNKAVEIMVIGSCFHNEIEVTMQKNGTSANYIEVFE